MVAGTLCTLGLYLMHARPHRKEWSIEVQSVPGGLGQGGRKKSSMAWSLQCKEDKSLAARMVQYYGMPVLCRLGEVP